MQKIHLRDSPANVIGGCILRKEYIGISTHSSRVYTKIFRKYKSRNIIGGKTVLYERTLFIMLLQSVITVDS